MKDFSVQLLTIEDVKRFVNSACLQPFDIDIISGRHVVDAKSILGLFSLNLSAPITVKVYGTEEDGRVFFETVKDFVL
ncbi:MAG: HPr family phosphocarrier protein [Oscillospiraceae bacterium]|nr:HPr family phosphocarrier protein [Oscillospiraceae bacterium]